MKLNCLFNGYPFHIHRDEGTSALKKRRGMRVLPPTVAHWKCEDENCKIKIMFDIAFLPSPETHSDSAPVVSSSCHPILLTLFFCYSRQSLVFAKSMY